jgi:hypothetical protein
MRLNFPYYVKTYPLPHSNALNPIFEAISNSIDAIEERRIENGEISITIERDSQPRMFKSSSELDPIENIIIRDNGIGFNEKNFESFSELSTSKKEHKGGKGLGRISWLKVFEYVKVESFYIENERVNHITFEFHLEEKAIKNLVVEEVISEDFDLYTEITLIKCRESYKGNFPKQRDTLARRIIMHFLPTFMVSSVPHIILSESNMEDLDLNNIFEEEIINENSRDEFTINNSKFDIVHLRLRYGARNNNRHRVYFIANGRVVEDYIISQNQISNLPAKLNDEDNNNDYVYNGYVESSFFNERVNQSRDSIMISEDEVEENLGLPSRELINQNIYKLIQKFLEDFIERSKKNKLDKIHEYINKTAPQYKYILNKYPEELDKISLSDVEKGRIEDELHRIHIMLRSKTKEGASALIQESSDQISSEDYKKRMEKYLENLSDIERANLTEYVVHRKIILDLLKRALEITEDGKYQREDLIHSHIFPLKKDSDELYRDQHNLWIVDERLTHNSYIASDKAFSQIPNFEGVDQSKKLKRPDIFSYSFATSDVEDRNSPYKSLDIIEFKRPMRDDYQDDENPISQVIDYIKIIRAEDARTEKGRNFRVLEGGVIHCHIICDITTKLREIMRDSEFLQVGDLDWYIKFHNIYNVFIEVKSFDYIVQIAEKRNKILFEKLDILDT